MQQGNFINLFLARHVSGLESRCVGRSGSQDHHPSKNSVRKTIRCNSTSNAPDDGRMYPKHVELRIHQGVGEEMSAHILCECEALASLRHAYLGSFFLEP